MSLLAKHTAESFLNFAKTAEFWRTVLLWVSIGVTCAFLAQMVTA